jgi:hypothetical protein
MDFKDVDIKDRKFRVTKFDARTGSKVAFKLVNVVGNVVGDVLGSTKPEEISLDFAKIGGALASISDTDFDYIQDACLKVTSEHLGAGLTPILNDNGSFAVLGLDHDTATVLALTVHALVFNVMDFFAESPLASIVTGALSSFQSNTPT